MHKGVELDIALLNPTGRGRFSWKPTLGTWAIGRRISLLKRARAKARLMLPRGYSVEATLVASRGFINEEKPRFLITTENPEEGLVPLPGEDNG